MKAFTSENPGIAVHDGTIKVGETGRGRSCTSVPLPPGAVVENDRLVECDGAATSALVYIPDQSGFRGSWYLRDARHTTEWDAIVSRASAHRPPDGDGALAEAAGHVLHDDCAACDAIAALSPERPCAAAYIAMGHAAQGIAGRAGGGPEYLLVLRDGQAVEIVRSGRLYGKPTVIQLACQAGVIIKSAPKSEALSRLAAMRWENLL